MSAVGEIAGLAGSAGSAGSAGLSPAAQAEAVTLAILDDLRAGRHRGVIVDSPPGAGKSTLVVRTAAVLAASGAPLMIVAQTNEQVDDLVERLSARLADELPAARIGRLGRTGYLPSARLAGLSNVVTASDVDSLGEPEVTISTAAKWAYVREGTWPWAIVDEAYQMRSDTLLAIAARFERALFVGDPGQLDPFSTVTGDRWHGLVWNPMQSAVAVLQRNNPDLPVHRLPVSWRLPRTAQDVVADAFYPFTGFRTGTGFGERGLVVPGPAESPVDDVLDVAATTGWGLLELPARHTMRTDAEAVAAVAQLTRRILERGTLATSGGERTRITPGRIAVGAAHRDQVVAIRAALGGLAATEGDADHPAAGSGSGAGAFGASGAGPGSAGWDGQVVVDTANRLQGREYEITVVLHPLSGRRDATAFHLEAGRLCVLASRHRQACLVVARAGIRELLDAHPTSDPVHLGEPVRFPDGWAANQAMLAHLATSRVQL
ncbi:AAA domain-containing protein [Parafrankia sp. EUN1f]|uniref:AAA domain-containing protein n=1 Tax=Parafrankia sp. EUN1f TaxID=102897 RepID=UPI0001C45FB8|nr:AAA domain-containing protein [Parafrankia sp. EUN1f]EFC81380.1 Superfamily I DNA and RNA helicase and helicase subunits-like protein [Parafrankia sp. EUN1f]